MICAVIDQKTGKVINAIIADLESATVPRGCILVAIEADHDKGAPVDTRWSYDDSKAEMLPPPEIAAEIEARKQDEVRAAADREAAAKR